VARWGPRSRPESCNDPLRQLIEEAPFHARGPIATAGGCLASQYLAAWILQRGAGEEAARQSLQYAAPVGEKEAYVERLLSEVRPFLPPA
jgi:hypothetical protein